MIQFRCWYCNRAYARPESAVGQRFECNCTYTLRVPKKSGGNPRVKTITDRLVELIVYGGGCAFLGLGLALLILSRNRWVMWGPEGTAAAFWVVVGLTGGGLVLGTICGERAIDWIGGWIRSREDR